MARADHYLQLPANQGQRSFGPLSDTVRIGSDPSTCHVVVAPHVGMEGVGIELERTADTGWRITLLGDTPHPCRMVRADGAVRRIASSDMFRVGETLEITGTVDHPQFTLVAVAGSGSGLASRPAPTSSGDAPVDAAKPRVGSIVVGGALVDEARRRVDSHVVANVPGVRETSDALRRGKGPWLAAGAALIVTVLLAGCAGVSAWALGLFGA